MIKEKDKENECDQKVIKMEVSKIQISRDDPETWQNLDIFMRFPEKGILSNRGLNHSNFMWKTRRLPKVRRAFGLIWGTDVDADAQPETLESDAQPETLESNTPNDVEIDSNSNKATTHRIPERDLVVSYDGANAFRPWKRKYDWLTTGDWWHLDQNAELGP